MGLYDDCPQTPGAGRLSDALDLHQGHGSGVEVEPHGHLTLR